MGSQQPRHTHGPAAAEPPKTPIPGVNKLIAIGSGKGGVGKTTVSVNLAISLAKMGRKVGLLDADVYGPSIPFMMGSEASPRAADEKKIHPVEKHGIQLISMGFFLDDQSPVIWRGPIVMGIIRQFLRDDYVSQRTEQEIRPGNGIHRWSAGPARSLLPNACIW